MIRYFLVFLLSCIVFISGCTQESQTATNQAIPEGFEALTLTDQQKIEIFEAAKKVGVEKVFVPSFVRKGQKLEKIITGDQVMYFSLLFSNENEETYLKVQESPGEVLLDGVIIEEKDTKINNDITAKWISFSNHKDNIEGASSGLYFQQDTTFIMISEKVNGKKNEFTKSAEEVATFLKPLIK
ncbi:hypothetical protein AV540_18555 [Brevibacillus parabrevis]|uniref:hypothetical protein n=1 Tax=Brevibacillus parabrevis TaxID=54914 RepID=UPI0007AC0D0A|nr:hypothetical protein [Brevibacillus parabrevis]KZE47771.1 hypothetical protein AV540_18555 [Brevibacillus parabrevis]